VRKIGPTTAPQLRHNLVIDPFERTAEEADAVTMLSDK
jgi:hypothetical protein